MKQSAEIITEEKTTPPLMTERPQSFFAAKIHEMRQPLQVMSLLHGVLAEKVKDQEARKMIARLDEVLESLNTILESFSLPKPGVLIQNTENRLETLDQNPYREPALTPPPLEKQKVRSSICIVDDNQGVREGMGAFLSSSGHSIELYESCEHFLAARNPDREGCLLIDALLPGMCGIELLQKLKENNSRLPAIMITGSGDVSLAVQAMKAGAVDFIEKPVNPKELLALVTDVLHQAQNASHPYSRETALARLACLSARERQIMDWIFAGHPSKNIAADLGISRRTVECHRANIMKKTGVRSLSELLKLALAAA